MTNPPQKIYYRKVRNLGEVFGATFGFIKRNFKTFFGSLMLLAGPFLLVGAATSSVMLGSSLGLTKIASRGFGNLLNELLIPYLLSLIFIFIGFVVYTVVLNKNLIQNEKLQLHEPLTVKQIISNFFGDFWRILGNTLLFLIVIIVTVILFALIFTGIGSLFTGMGGGGGAVLGIVFLVLIILALVLIFVPMMAYLPVAAYFVCQRDRINIFAAFRKVFYYLRGNFWMTWLVSFIALICYSVMAGIAQIPVFIITIITSFSRIKSTVGYGTGEESTPILLVVITVICSLLSYAVLSIFHLMSIYQYTNLEEKKEGSSIIEKINTID
jgi:hypothetical protein